MKQTSAAVIHVKLTRDWGTLICEQAAQPNQNRALHVVSDKFVDTEVILVCYLFSQWKVHSYYAYFTRWKN